MILDDEPTAGGAWPHTWPSLRLFSPAEFESAARQADAPLQDGFPPASHVLDYLTAYETHCDLPVERPVRMSAVRRDSRDLVVESGNGQWRARRGISAIGTWQRPFWPIYPGAHTLAGRQLHTVDYRTPADFAVADVAVVGAGRRRLPVRPRHRSRPRRIHRQSPPRPAPQGRNGRMRTPRDERLPPCPRRRPRCTARCVGPELLLLTSPDLSVVADMTTPPPQTRVDAAMHASLGHATDMMWRRSPASTSSAMSVPRTRLRSLMSEV